MLRSTEELTSIMTLGGAMIAELRNDFTRFLPNPTRDEAKDLIKQHEDKFLELAMLARKLANSYRNFDVGAVGVGLRTVTEPGHSPWTIRFAANTKEENGEKYCGEQRLMDAALRKGWTHVLAFFVAGEPQNDHGSGRKDTVLLPCEVCRWRMRGLMREQKALIKPDALVIACNCHKPWMRKHTTVAGLHEAHCEPLE